jgi:HK97 family phage major capsid protein
MPSGIGVAGAGAELTSEQVARILVNPLQARSVVLAAGPRVFDSQGDPLSIPKLAPMSAVGMTAENVAVPESDPVFSEVQLLPATLKSFKRGYRISNELVRHSVLAIATVMGQAIVERTALEIDNAFLTGTGTPNTITGFTSMAGTSGVTLAASAKPTIDDLLTAQDSLLGANASLATAAWFMHPTKLTELRKIREGSGTGSYMLMQSDQGIASGTVTGPGASRFTLLGAPVFVTTQLPGTQVGGRIILADMNQVAVGRDTAPSLGVFTETFADVDQLYLRVVARYDIKPLNAAGVYIITTA